MLAASQSERQPLLSTTELTPLFWVHELHRGPQAEALLPALYAVLRADLEPRQVQALPSYALLLMGTSGLLFSDTPGYYYVCPGASCQVPDCARAVPQ